MSQYLNVSLYELLKEELPADCGNHDCVWLSVVGFGISNLQGDIKLYCMPSSNAPEMSNVAPTPDVLKTIT